MKSLQGVLDQLYATMLTQSSQLIGVAQGIAGFAALWFIGVRVSRHIANVEPINVFPLLRPFLLSIAIALFPYVIALLNGILQPTVEGTQKMVDNANASIELLLKQKEEALKGTATYQLLGLDGKGNDNMSGLYSGIAGALGLPGLGIDYVLANAKAYFSFKNAIKEWMAEILELVYEAAALCINALRTFNLIVLAILGPLVFGLSVFDGFQNGLQTWLARFINVFMWLPVANIFGAIIANIQVNMLKLDLNQIQTTGGTYFSKTDAGYLIFLVIGIVGYFTVPTVASYIVSVGENGSVGSKFGSIVVRGAKQTVGIGVKMFGAGKG